MQKKVRDNTYNQFLSAMKGIMKESPAFISRI